MQRREKPNSEDLSTRKNDWFIQFNNYTTQDHLSETLFIYQSGWKKYCPPNWLSGPAIYDHYIIHYLIDGAGTYYDGRNNAHKLKKGDAFLIPPYQEVRYQADSICPWKYYWVGFNGTEANKLLKLCGLDENNLTFTYDIDDKLEYYLECITSTNLISPAQEYALLGYLYQIFSLLISNNQKALFTTYDDYLYQAIQYIRENYQNCELSVQHIADHIRIDRSYLYRVFDKLLQQSVQQYVISFRLKKAKLLLKHSNCSVGEIALSCGFSDQSYFASAFKKNFNISPLKYRQKNIVINKNEMI